MSTLNPILEEIRRLQDNEASGILKLSGVNGQRVEVFVREGLIESVNSNIAGRRLGDYLQKDGYPTARELDAVEPIARHEKILLGEAIVRKGLLNKATVAAAVRRQAAELLDHVFKNGFSVESFKSDLRAFYVPARMTFGQLMLELCRSNAAPFEPVPNTTIALSEGIDLSRFQWLPQELYVLSELQSPRSFEELLRATGLPQQNLKSTLGVLAGLAILTINEAIGGLAKPTTAVTAKGDFPLEELVPEVTNALLHEKLEVARNESSFTSEQFKNLKVQINEIGSTIALKVLTVSSPNPKDGKSLIGANLAFSFALDPGRRVILVDCDLRNPTLGDYLGVTSEPGLLQYLANGHLSPYCYVRRVQNLYFLTSGGVAPNPVEILSMGKMKQLIDHLRRDFDTVILDAPPYFPISDARIVTGLSDGVIMVVRRGKTSCASSDRAFKAVDRKKLLGVVFNDAQPLPFQGDHDFGYYDYGRNKKGNTSSLKIGNTPKNYLKS